MTMDEHIDCDRQLNDAEGKIKELEANVCPSWMGKEKGCNEAQDVVELEERIKKLEAENANWKQRYIEAVNDLKQALKAINS